MAKEPKYPKQGYTVLDSIEVDSMKDRELPNSDPAKGDNFTYQEQPWDKGSDRGREKD